VFEATKGRTWVKDMHRTQARLTRASQIFDRIFDENRASGVNALVGKNVPHQGD